jgi:murein DD-endopeptidase MepM/ murein hydrolase activator NlpD
MERRASIRTGMRHWRTLLAVCAPLLLANCASFSDDDYPPASGSYLSVTAQRGDTVSEIAYRYHVSQDNIVAINDLRDRDTLYAGQTLKVPAYGHVARRDYSPPHHIAYNKTSEPAVRPINTSYEPSRTNSKPADAVWWQNLDLDSIIAPDAQFLWPVKGTVISPYGARPNGERNDGINIAAADGAAIRAAAAGTVSYVGNELKGYGNLVLIRHDNGYVTAYAHTGEILVARGQRVAQGETIAYAGETGGVSAPQVHFEIRRGTTPVDPKPLLIASR